MNTAPDDLTTPPAEPVAPVDVNDEFLRAFRHGAALMARRAPLSRGPRRVFDEIQTPKWSER